MKDLFGINARRTAVQENIEKGFNGTLNFDDELEKARSGIYADTAENRKLDRVGQQYGSKKQEDEPESKPKGKGEEEPKGGSSSEGKKDMGSHASKASDGALKRAAADENAPEEVRDAAKKELKKRGKGENGGNYEKWKSVFDKMKKVDGNFTEEMYDDLAELAQKHGVDYDKEGEESLKKLPIKEVEKIVNAYSKGEVIEDEKDWTPPYNMNLEVADELWTGKESKQYDKALEEGDEKTQSKLLKIAFDRAKEKGIDIRSEVSDEEEVENTVKDAFEKLSTVYDEAVNEEDEEDLKAMERADAEFTKTVSKLILEGKLDKKTFHEIHQSKPSWKYGIDVDWDELEKIAKYQNAKRK